MFQAYTASLIGLWVVLATIVVQLIVATRAHRGQEKMIPGTLDPKLGHESFVFRSHRAFLNSLENIVPFLGVALLAVLSGFSPFRLAVVVWVYALARILHMALYYAIATDTNPSPRSYAFIVGGLATLYLLIDVGIYLLLGT